MRHIDGVSPEDAGPSSGTGLRFENRLRVPDGGVAMLRSVELFETRGLVREGPFGLPLVHLFLLTAGHLLDVIIE